MGKELQFDHVVLTRQWVLDLGSCKIWQKNKHSKESILASKYFCITDAIIADGTNINFQIRSIDNIWILIPNHVRIHFELWKICKKSDVAVISIRELLLKVLKAHISFNCIVLNGVQLGTQE